MKKIAIKRLVYHHLETNEIIYGGEEYDGNLSDENILDSFHEIGKTEWRPTAWRNGQWCDELYLLKKFPGSDVTYPAYHIYVDEFYRYEKTRFDTLKDSIKRILRI